MSRDSLFKLSGVLFDLFRLLSKLDPSTLITLPTPWVFLKETLFLSWFRVTGCFDRLVTFLFMASLFQIGAGKLDSVIQQHFFNFI